MFSISNRSSHRRRERRRVGCCTLIPSVYWPYIMTQHRRAIAAFADGNALIGWPRSSKAGGRAFISAVLLSSRAVSNYYYISMFYRGCSRQDRPLCQPVRRPEILPLAIREMLESSRADGGSEIVESRVPPYANSGYRGVYALFIGVDRGRLDFESLDMNAPMSAATSSGFSSSAKWPASIRWTSASGISRL